jgi:hypothetical protein
MSKSHKSSEKTAQRAALPSRTADIGKLAQPLPMTPLPEMPQANASAAPLKTVPVGNAHSIKSKSHKATKSPKSQFIAVGAVTYLIEVAPGELAPGELAPVSGTYELRD